MKKKLFSIIMCVLMVMCFMPTATFADPLVEGDPPATGGQTADGAQSDGVQPTETEPAVTTTWIDAVSEQPAGYANDTEQKIVTISSAEDLAWFAKQINSINTKQTGDNAGFKGYSINITEDIDLSGKLWIPIDPETVNPSGKADRSDTFSNKLLDGATINGNGHTITGMTIHNTVRGPQDGSQDGDGQSCYYYAGFIGRSYGALTIQNLSFTNASIDAHNEINISKRGSSSMAVVLGLNNENASLVCENVNVDNCTITGYTKVGGFTGQDSGTLSLTKCSVTNCNIILETFTKTSEENAVPAFAAPISGYKSNAAKMTLMGVKNTNNAITLDDEFKKYSDGTHYYYTDGDWNMTYVNTVYCTGYTLSDGVNKDTITISEKTQSKYGKELRFVAEINGYAYTSLDVAISAATSGQTIELLSDITLTENIDQIGRAHV